MCIQNQKFPMTAGWGNFKAYFNSVSKPISIHSFGTFQALPAFPTAHSQLSSAYRISSQDWECHSPFPISAPRSPSEFSTHRVQGWNWICPRNFFTVVHTKPNTATEGCSIQPESQNLNHGSCLQEPDEFFMHLPASYHFLLCNIRHEWLISFSHMPVHT